MLPLLNLPREIPRIERGRALASEGVEATGDVEDGPSRLATMNFPRQAPTAAWPYAGGILIWKEVIDFFDDSAYIKNLVQNIVNTKLDLEDTDDQAVITNIDIEAIVPIANQIRVRFTISNLRNCFAKITTNDAGPANQTWSQWLTTKAKEIATNNIPDTVRIGVTFDIRITGTQELRELRVKLVELDVISDAIGADVLSKLLTIPLTEVINNKILGKEGYPVVSRTADHSSKDNHWLFQTPAAP